MKLFRPTYLFYLFFFLIGPSTWNFIYPFSLSYGGAIKQTPNPRKNGFWVSDPQKVLKWSEYKAINRKLEALNKKTKVEFAVVVHRSLPVENQKEFAHRLFNYWGVGRKGYNDGLLFTFAVKERQWAFETGYGLEAIVPNHLQEQIFNNYMRADFKAGKYGQGLLKGVDEIVSVLAKTPAVKSIGSVDKAFNLIRKGIEERQVIMDFQNKISPEAKKNAEDEAARIRGQHGVRLFVAYFASLGLSANDHDYKGLNIGGPYALLNRRLTDYVTKSPYGERLVLMLVDAAPYPSRIADTYRSKFSSAPAFQYSSVEAFYRPEEFKDLRIFQESKTRGRTALWERHFRNWSSVYGYGQIDKKMLQIGADIDTAYKSEESLLFYYAYRWRKSAKQSRDFRRGSYFLLGGLPVTVFLLVLWLVLIRKPFDADRAWWTRLIGILFSLPLLATTIGLLFWADKFNSVLLGSSAVVFGLVGCLGGILGTKKILRNKPRHCPEKDCGRAMLRLSEKEDDDHLKEGQQTEESVGSIDYDVWLCPEHEQSIIIDEYPKAFGKFKKCPKCKFKTLYTVSVTITSATYTSTGRGENRATCSHCDYKKTTSYVIPRLQRQSSSSSGSSGGWSSSSSSSSSSGGSFGGGSSGGGGASGSW